MTIPVTTTRRRPLRTTRAACTDPRPMVYFYVTAAPVEPEPAPIEIRFRVPLSCRARTAWADALRAMDEMSYKATEGKRYRVDFINHVGGVAMAKLPSCMNAAVDGIADALEVERAKLLIGYRQGEPDLHGVEVVITEVQS